MTEERPKETGQSLNQTRPNFNILRRGGGGRHITVPRGLLTTAKAQPKLPLSSVRRSSLPCDDEESCHQAKKPNKAATKTTLLR